MQIQNNANIVLSRRWYKQKTCKYLLLEKKRYRKGGNFKKDKLHCCSRVQKPKPNPERKRRRR